MLECFNMKLEQGANLYSKIRRKVLPSMFLVGNSRKRDYLQNDSIAVASLFLYTSN